MMAARLTDASTTTVVCRTLTALTSSTIAAPIRNTPTRICVVSNSGPFAISRTIPACWSAGGTGT
jgi:hypothetical protein